MSNNNKENIMALVTPDMSEAQEPLGVGVHTARIIEAEAVTSQKGLAMLQ